VADGPERERAEQARAEQLGEEVDRDVDEQERLRGGRKRQQSGVRDDAMDG
jgi:hypothetical protein